MARRWTLRALVAAVLMAYPAVGLYPYRWAPPTANTARPLPQGGLVFAPPGPGTARTDRAPGWVGDAIRSGRIEIELQVRPHSRHQQGPARIMSLSRDRHNRNFTIGQDQSDLILRLRTPWSDANGKPARRVPGVFAEPRWIDMRIAVRPERLAIEVDGEPVLQDRLPPQPLRTWNRSFRLALGNELTNDRPWLGEIRRAVVHTSSRVVNYAEPGAVTLPSVLWVLDRPPRVVPLRGLELGDAALNVAGFVPLGILLAVWLRPRHRFARGLLVILLTSAAIEGLQFFVAGRTPAVDDLLLNGLGGTIGLLAGSVAGRRPGYLRL